nr:MAG TPA: hypothetical protein [Caudoviricetes sp.]
MDTLTIIALLLMGLCLGQWRAIVKLHGEATDLRRSKDDLRERMSKINYYLSRQLDRMASENYRIRTQLNQLRKEQQKQDN